MKENKPTLEEFSKSDKKPTDEEFNKLISDKIIESLANDKFKVPFNVLFQKVIKATKQVYPNVFIDLDRVKWILEDLIEKSIVGKIFIERIQDYRYFLAFQEFPIAKDENGNEIIKFGQLNYNPKKKCGFITVYDKYLELSSSYFVHCNNINGAKNNDFVKFAELDVSSRVQSFKSNLKDAKVLVVLTKEEIKDLRKVNQ